LRDVVGEEKKHRKGEKRLKGGGGKEQPAQESRCCEKGREEICRKTDEEKKMIREIRRGESWKGTEPKKRREPVYTERS